MTDRGVIDFLVVAVIVNVIANQVAAQNSTGLPTIVNGTITTKPGTSLYNPDAVSTAAPAVVGLPGVVGPVVTAVKQTTPPYVQPDAAPSVAGSQMFSAQSVAGSQPVTFPSVAGGGSQPVTFPSAAGGGSQPVTFPSAAGGGSQPVTFPTVAGAGSQAMSVPGSSVAGAQPVSSLAPVIVPSSAYPAGPVASSNYAQTSFPAALPPGNQSPSSNVPISALMTTPEYLTMNVMHVQVNCDVTGGPIPASYNPQIVTFIANLAQISDSNRIQNVTFQSNPSQATTDVLQFSITQTAGSTPSSDAALATLKNSIQAYTPTWRSSNFQYSIRFVSSLSNWTDFGPCPNTACQNGGRCVSTSLTGGLSCQCQASYIGSDCAVAATMTGGGGQPLLGLLVLPILFVVVLIGLIVAFFIIRRRQEEKKVPQVDNDVASVYTGSKFGTVSEQGIRNMAYPTIGKSYAVAFSDSAFSTMESQDGSGDRSMGLF